MSRHRRQLWAIAGNLAAALVSALFVVAAFARREGGPYVYFTFAALWTVFGLLCLYSALALLRERRRERRRSNDDNGG